MIIIFFYAGDSHLCWEQEKQANHKIKERWGMATKWYM